MHRMALVLLGLLVAFPAQALDPYMWGIGPRIGTMVIPGKYPLQFPDEVGDSFERVRHDVTVGVEGTYYVNAFNRMVADAGLGFGSGFSDAHFLVKWNYVGQTGAMDFLLGAGTGFGNHTFRADDGSKLSVPYYPIRAEVAALIRDNSRGYQGTVYGQLAVPANHYWTDENGDQPEAGGGLYFTLGVELAVMFGDFTPPRPRN